MINEECKTCGKSNGTLLSCQNCKSVKYCGSKCQSQDWKTHKSVCKSMEDVESVGQLSDFGSSNRVWPRIVQKLTTAEFRSAVSKYPFLVVFVLPRCPSCLAAKPEVARLAGMTNGRYLVGQVDIESEPQLRQYVPRTVPHFKVFIPGQQPITLNVPEQSRTAENLNQLVLNNLGSAR